MPWGKFGVKAYLQRKHMISVKKLVCKQFYKRKETDVNLKKRLSHRFYILPSFEWNYWEQKFRNLKPLLICTYQNSWKVDQIFGVLWWCRHGYLQGKKKKNWFKTNKTILYWSLNIKIKIFQIIIILKTLGLWARAYGGSYYMVVEKLKYEIK